MATKTFKVNQLIVNTNKILASHTETPDFAKGLIIMLEDILHQTGNYNGFRYLTIDEVPDSCLPGIHWIKNKQQQNLAPTPKFTLTDSTRVHYF